jgi:hypothetical protein
MHMADPSRYPDAGVRLDGGSTPPTPRWVKAFGAIVVVVVVLFIVLHLTGMSLGGPGSHTPAGHRGPAPLEGGHG